LLILHLRGFAKEPRGLRLVRPAWAIFPTTRPLVGDVHRPTINCHFKGGTLLPHLVVTTCTILARQESAPNALRIPFSAISTASHNRYLVPATFLPACVPLPIVVQPEQQKIQLRTWLTAITAPGWFEKSASMAETPSETKCELIKRCWYPAHANPDVM